MPNKLFGLALPTITSFCLISCREYEQDVVIKGIPDEGENSMVPICADSQGFYI